MVPGGCTQWRVMSRSGVCAAWWREVATRLRYDAVVCQDHYTGEPRCRVSLPCCLPGRPAPSSAYWEACEQGEALLAVLFPHLSGLRVHRAEDTGAAVAIWASRRAGQRCCPRCGQGSSRVHGGYSRVVADENGPAAGQC